MIKFATLALGFVGILSLLPLVQKKKEISVLAVIGTGLLLTSLSSTFV